jgi:hypothetical protein
MGKHDNDLFTGGFNGREFVGALGWLAHGLL